MSNGIFKQNTADFYGEMKEKNYTQVIPISIPLPRIKDVAVCFNYI